MDAELVVVGRCRGCDRMMTLDDGVCRGCLDDPRRGRAWAELSHRCRTDHRFAWLVLTRIRTAGGRRLFILMYRDALLSRPREGRRI